MSQILDPLPAATTDSMICCYVNATSQIVVARITNIPNWYFERVVFPGQRLVFEALPEALLEIHTGMMASAILSDTIPCHKLGVSEKTDSQLKSAPKQLGDRSEQVETQLVSKQQVQLKQDNLVTLTVA